MKKMLLFCLVFLFWSPLVKADLGSCTVYHAQFHLKDGTTLTGLFEYWSENIYLDNEERNKHCSNKGVFLLFKEHQKNGTPLNYRNKHIISEADYGKAVVYQDLSIIKPNGITKKWAGYHDKNYGFVNEGDVFLIDSTEVERMTFLRAEYSKRDWLTSGIIIASNEMMNTARTQKYWNDLIVYESGKKDSLAFSQYNEFLGYYLINYNSQNNIAELKRLANLKLKFLTRPNPYLEALKEENNFTPKMKQMAREKFERDIQTVKDWFWERGIVMVRVNGTC